MQIIFWLSNIQIVIKHRLTTYIKDSRAYSSFTFFLWNSELSYRFLQAYLVAEVAYIDGKINVMLINVWAFL